MTKIGFEPWAVCLQDLSSCILYPVSYILRILCRIHGVTTLCIAHVVTILLILTKITMELNRDCERVGSVCAPSRVVIEERNKFLSSLEESQKRCLKWEKL